MRKRDHWHDLIKQVEREYVAVTAAVEVLDERLRADPAFLRSRRIGMPDFERMRLRLEGTYLIRLFAVYESCLREVWSACYGKTTEPPSAHLVDAVAGKTRALTVSLRDQAHAVRNYRNALVHGGEADSVRLTEARRALSRYLSHLPDDW